MNNKKIRQMADNVIEEGTENTEDGRWSIPYDELYLHFGEKVTDYNANGERLKEELLVREQVNELIMTEDAIEMTYHLEHCPRCQQGGIAGAMHLVSLMGCNIYDEHNDYAPAEDLSEEDQTQALSM